MRHIDGAIYLRSQFATSKNALFFCQPKAKLLWKTRLVAPDGFIDALSLHLVKHGQVAVEHDLHASNCMDKVLDRSIVATGTRIPPPAVEPLPRLP